MGRMKGIRGRRGLLGLMAGAAGLLTAASIAALGPAREANADWPWTWRGARAACGHPGCHRNRCLATEGWAGNWYWMRSPDQEQRVIMARYNRYCIRCHGIDGRGVWDIPDIPDFTDPRWQQSRPDPQIVNILMEGRGAVMPTFRGTLSLEESWAMARYLRTFVPGTESARPDVGRAAPARTPPATPAQPNSTAPPGTPAHPNSSGALPALPSAARPQSAAR